MAAWPRSLGGAAALCHCWSCTEQPPGAAAQWATGNPGYNSYGGYHAYVFDWQPGYVRWYIDGRLIDEMSAASYSVPQEWQMVTFSMWWVLGCKVDWGKVHCSKVHCSKVLALTGTTSCAPFTEMHLHVCLNMRCMRDVLMCRRSAYSTPRLVQLAWHACSARAPCCCPARAIITCRLALCPPSAHSTWPSTAPQD